MLEPSKNRAQDDKMFKKKKTGLEKKLIFGVAVVSVLALVFIVLYFTKKSCPASEEECTDKFCVKASAEILDFVDLKIDPCQDFYHYVCGHYMKEAVKKDSATPILQIMSEFKNEMKAIIIDPVKKKDTKPVVAMKKFYQACMNETKIDADKDKNFLETINLLGGWPLINGSSWEEDSFDWVDFYVKSVLMGVDVLGFFTLKSARASNNQTILRISGPTMTDLTKGKFTSVMNDIAKIYGAPAGFATEVIDTYELIENVRKFSEDVIEEEDYDEKISTVKDLIQVCPQFPWLKMMNGLSREVREFKEDTEVVFGTLKKYCNKLDGLLRKTPKRVIANYLIANILEVAHVFLGRKVRNAYQNIDEDSDDRYTTCLDLTDERFKFLKETVYIRKKTKPAVKEQLEELIDLTKEVFIDHIKMSTWMDEETKQRGVEKTKLIERVVGAEDVLYDEETFDGLLGVNELEFSSDNAFQILKEKRIRENKHLWEKLYKEEDNWESFFTNANQVNAFFAFNLNVMIVPAPILNSIFFNYKMPAFMNYGAIGRVVGHEIMHGFGEDGRNVLLENDEMIDWWTNATAEAFNKTKQCVIEEYERVPFRYKLNGTITLEENLADFVGIDVAYEAYAKWVKKHGAEKKLPGVPLTPKQVFWIQTGAFLCFRKLEDESVDLEDEDVHAIPAFRVTAGARHSRYFAKDFNCPEGSFMNPKNKCRIL